MMEIDSEEAWYPSSQLGSIDDHDGRQVFSFAGSRNLDFGSIPAHSDVVVDLTNNITIDAVSVGSGTSLKLNFPHPNRVVNVQARFQNISCFKTFRGGGNGRVSLSESAEITLGDGSWNLLRNPQTSDNQIDVELSASDGDVYIEGSLPIRKIRGAARRVRLEGPQLASAQVNIKGQVTIVKNVWNATIRCRGPLTVDSINDSKIYRCDHLTATAEVVGTRIKTSNSVDLRKGATGCEFEFTGTNRSTLASSSIALSELDLILDGLTDPEQRSQLTRGWAPLKSCQVSGSGNFVLVASQLVDVGVAGADHILVGRVSNTNSSGIEARGRLIVADDLLGRSMNVAAAEIDVGRNVIGCTRINASRLFIGGAVSAVRRINCQRIEVQGDADVGVLDGGQFTCIGILNVRALRATSDVSIVKLELPPLFIVWRPAQPGSKFDLGTQILPFLFIDTTAAMQEGAAPELVTNAYGGKTVEIFGDLRLDSRGDAALDKLLLGADVELFLSGNLECDWIELVGDDTKIVCSNSVLVIRNELATSGRINHRCLNGPSTVRLTGHEEGKPSEFRSISCAGGVVHADSAIIGLLRSLDPEDKVQLEVDQGSVVRDIKGSFEILKIEGSVFSTSDPPTIYSMPEGSGGNVGHLVGIDPSPLSHMSLSAIASYHVFEPDKDAIERLAKVDGDLAALRERAQWMAKLVEQTQGRVLSGATAASIRWSAARLHHRSVGGRLISLERIGRRVHYLLGYSQKPTWPLVAWIVMSCLVALFSVGSFPEADWSPLPSNCDGRYVDAAVCASSFSEYFAEVVRAMFFPFRTLRLDSDDGPFSYLGVGLRPIAAVAVGIPFLFAVIALKNFFRSPVER